MTKVLIAGWVGSENMGDEAILSSVISSLPKEFQLCAFSVNEKRTDQLHGIATAPFEIFMNPIRFITAIKDCDVMLVGGGGILQDQTSIFNTPRYLYKAIIANLMKKKVMFYAVGVGPLRYSFTKNILRFVLNKASAITVRDEESKRLLIDLGVKTNLVEVTFDPVINLEHPDSDEAIFDFSIEIPARDGKKVVGICLRHWFDTQTFLPVHLAQKLNYKQKGGQDKYDEFVKEIALAIDILNQTGQYNFLFIPYWYTRDSLVHQDVINSLKNKKNIYKLSKQYTPEKLLGLFTQLDLVIAMRLHACIFAASVAKPFLALSYSSKVDNFLKELDAERYKFNLNGLEGAKLSDSVLNLVDIIDKERLKKSKLNERKNLDVLLRVLGSK